MDQRDKEILDAIRRSNIFVSRYGALKFQPKMTRDEYIELISELEEQEIESKRFTLKQ